MLYTFESAVQQLYLNKTEQEKRTVSCNFRSGQSGNYEGPWPSSTQIFRMSGSVMTTWQCGQFLLSWALVLSLHAGNSPSQMMTVYKNCPGSLLYLTSMSHSVYKQVMAPSRQHGFTPETSERKRRKHPRSWASGLPLVSPSNLLDSCSYSC